MSGARALISWERLAVAGLVDSKMGRGVAEASFRGMKM